VTVAYCALVFFLIPFFAPLAAPGLRTDARFTGTNRIFETTLVREAAPSDVARREAQIEQWTQRRAAAESAADSAQRQQRLDDLGPQPEPLSLGDAVIEKQRTGGKAIFWEKVVAIDEQGAELPSPPLHPVGSPQQIDENATRVELAWDEGIRRKGVGAFQIDYLLYSLLRLDLTTRTDAMLDTLNLPPKIIMPFLVMILVSLVTPRCGKEGLDRYYAKMKTPVVPDRKQDEENLAQAYADPAALESKKLFPGTSLEFQKPTRTDVTGFIICFAVCFAIIGLAILVARIGA
jgi:solute:Na+ symporter, SSS family